MVTEWFEHFILDQIVQCGHATCKRKLESISTTRHTLSWNIFLSILEWYYNSFSIWENEFWDFSSGKIWIWKRLGEEGQRLFPLTYKKTVYGQEWRISTFIFTWIPFGYQSINLVDNESNCSKVILLRPNSDGYAADFLKCHLIPLIDGDLKSTSK